MDLDIAGDHKGQKGKGWKGVSGPIVPQSGPIVPHSGPLIPQPGPLVPQPGPPTRAGENCKIVFDEVWEETCSTNYDKVCVKKDIQKCQEVATKECGPVDEQRCSMVFEQKCKKIPIPFCNVEWQKSCKNVPVCTQIPENKCETGKDLSKRSYLNNIKTDLCFSRQESLRDSY